MAKIGKKPFLDILIKYIAMFGFKRFILCAGYKANVIKEYYKNKKGKLKILISKEEKPLGTAGAIKNAKNLIRSNPFIVMNGDSFCPVNLYKFINFHINKKALISIVLANTKTNREYGVVTLGNSQQILKFDEKIKQEDNSLVNAGVYLFAIRALSLIPSGRKFSLEYDLFPKTVNRATYGYTTEEFFVDIGTPKSYQTAKRLLGNLKF